MEPEIFDTKMRKYGIFVAKMCKYGIFVAKICKYGIFVAKICKYGIFVAKICKYAFNDSFFRFSGSHDSAASLAALPNAPLSSLSSSYTFSTLAWLRMGGWVSSRGFLYSVT